MIDFYTWSTPNGRKVAIMLEACGLAYTTHKIDIGKNDQFSPTFLAVNPNGKIPAIVDNGSADGKPLAVFESGAILIYLAEKTGKFLPTDARTRAAVLQWLMFQMGGVGPMFGQAHHFMKFAPEKVPYGIARYSKETRRLYGVMDKRLGESAYLASDELSIADMATVPWVARHAYHEVDLAEFPNVKRWHDTIMARPAVVRAMAY
jgi:GST-like protein